MAYDVITDPDKQVAVLIDPDAMRALGPALLGPDAAPTLTAFVGALDYDPATVLPWRLDSDWQEFVVAIQAMQDEAARTAEGTPPGASGDPAALVTDPAAASLVEPVAPQSAPADTDLPAPELAAVPETPVWTPAPPPERCPNCSATTFEGDGEARVCAICGAAVPVTYVG